MIRRLTLSVLFGALVGFLARRQSDMAAGLMAGIFSGVGFWIISSVLRARALRRHGEIPLMQPGEEALLYGPCEVSDASGSSRAWAYLSNRRLMLRDEEGGVAVDLGLSDIDELRPDKGGVLVVTKNHGLLKLKLPDSKRWLDALRQAVRH